MRSKIEIELKANGTLEEITQGEDKIFQGAVGVTEYHLSIADGITGDYNWRPTDIVYMSLKRNDGQTAQVKMTAENGGWVWTSNGWETDVDIVGTGDLEVSFICKRYSLVSVGTVAFEKTTEKIDLIVYESAGYVPQNIDIEIAEELQEAINVLQLDKVGRYSVSEENLPYLPAEIVYDTDGEKTPNNLYFDFTHDVVDFDGETYSKTGAVFVTLNDTTQTELFLTSDGKQFVRISGASFVPATQADLQTFTYDKAVLDSKFDLKQDKLDNDLNTTSKNVVGAINELKSDIDDGLGEGFVKLDTDQTIEGIKTFTDSPIVPTPTANTHATNRSYVQGYTYSKEEVDNLTSPISFDLMSEFTSWLAGTFVREDGLLPSDLLIGKKVIIKEAGQNNYQVSSVPVINITNFKILVEDNKTLAEIGATTFDDITATDGQDCVEQINDKVNLKNQVTELADLIVETTDWVDNTTNFYYDLYRAEFTDPTKQRFDLISAGLAQNTTLSNEQIVFLGIEVIAVGENYYNRIFVDKVPSIDLTFKVLLETYTDSVVEAGIISASAVTYDNTTSGLIATNVNSAIDELQSKKIDKTLSIITSDPQYAVMLQTNGNPKIMPNGSVGSFVMAGQTPKNAVFDNFGRLGSYSAPEDATDFTNKNYVDALTPTLIYSNINTLELFAGTPNSTTLKTASNKQLTDLTATLKQNAMYNARFKINYTYLDLDGITTKNGLCLIDCFIKTYSGVIGTGNFNQISITTDSGPMQERNNYILFFGEVYIEDSGNKLNINNISAKLVESVGNGAVTNLDDFDFEFENITDLQVVEIPYKI